MEQAHQDKSYYANRFTQFQHPSQKVGWKNEVAQKARFEQFIPLFRSVSPFTIADLGCGMGHFYFFVQEAGYQSFQYHGYDRNATMITECEKVFLAKKLRNASFKQIYQPEEIEIADYVIASGIFNLKFDATPDVWQQEVLQTIQTMHQKSKKGFGFNILSSYSDKEYQREELFYADPLYYFNHCITAYSKNVDLLHSYGQYDFTILVHKS